MHEPLPRDMGTPRDPSRTQSGVWVWVCVLVVVLSFVLVGVALIAGELGVGRPDQAFSGMPLL